MAAASGIRHNARYLAATLAGSIVLFTIAAALSDVPVKRLVPMGGALAILVLGIAAGQTRRFLLFALVVSLTYNHNYFFERFEQHGSYGPYWCPSDVFLAALLLLWAYERGIGRVPARPRGPSTALWIVPLCLAGLVSAYNAPHPEWTGFEMLRLVRMLVIAWYLRFNLGPGEWRIAIAGFAVAVLYQAIQGIVYVATGTTLGLASIFGTAGGDVAIQQFLSGTEGGPRRAQGTLGHPNTLAVYFLMVGPLFVALALALRPSLRRLAYAAVAACVVAGLVATMSRTAWFILAAQISLIVIFLTVYAYLNARQALATLIVGSFVGMLLLAPFADLIYARLTGDFHEMVAFRMHHDLLALEIWRTSPLTGIGLNNYSDMLGQFDPTAVAAYDRFEATLRRIWEVRVTSWVHNIYLLFLAETGVLGLAALLVYYAAFFVVGLRALRRTGGELRVASLGLMIGALGLLIHGVQESAFWIDPITYTSVLILSMLNNAPGIQQHESMRRRARLPADDSNARRPAGDTRRETEES